MISVLAFFEFANFYVKVGGFILSLNGKLNIKLTVTPSSAENKSETFGFPQQLFAMHLPNFDTLIVLLINI